MGTLGIMLSACLLLLIAMGPTLTPRLLLQFCPDALVHKNFSF